MPSTFVHRAIRPATWAGATLLAAAAGLAAAPPAGAQASAAQVAGSGLQAAPVAAGGDFNPPAGAPGLRLGARWSVLGSASAAGPNPAFPATATLAPPAFYGAASGPVRLEATYRLGANWGLWGQAGLDRYGSGPGKLWSLQDVPQAGLAGPGAVGRELLGLGAYRLGTWLPGDRLRLMVYGAPRPGFLNAPGYDAAAVPAYLAPVDGRGAGLRPGGGELATELSYLAPLGASSSIGLSLSQAALGLHELGPSEERMMSLRFATRF